MHMSERVLINFVGEPASGKDFACARLAQLGCRIHRPSDALREYAEANAIALTSDRQQMAVLHKQVTTKDPFALARSRRTLWTKRRGNQWPALSIRGKFFAP